MCMSDRIYIPSSHVVNEPVSESIAQHGSDGEWSIRDCFEHDKSGDAHPLLIPRFATCANRTLDRSEEREKCGRSLARRRFSVYVHQLRDRAASTFRAFVSCLTPRLPSIHILSHPAPHIYWSNRVGKVPFSLWSSHRFDQLIGQRER
jgi:hypothetical protein